MKGAQWEAERVESSVQIAVEGTVSIVFTVVHSRLSTTMLLLNNPQQITQSSLAILFSKPNVLSPRRPPLKSPL
jgi:hypothetical protein